MGFDEWFVKIYPGCSVMDYKANSATYRASLTAWNAALESRTLKLPENQTKLSFYRLDQNTWVDGYNKALEEVKKLNGVE